MCSIGFLNSAYNNVIGIHILNEQTRSLLNSISVFFISIRIRLIPHAARKKITIDPLFFIVAQSLEIGI